tara:strand:- start:3118 stop:3813 length:696 start_codon:yes stop_codon:yes gene_type:complete
MSYSKYINILVQNSGSFSFDHYSQGLRKYIREEALNKKIGKVKKIPIDSKFINKSPVALVLGETNRHNQRYHLIKDLLDEYLSSKKFTGKHTRYFKKLFKPFEKNNFLSRHRSQKEIERKIDRVIKLYKWMKQNKGDISGVSSYISGNKIKTKASDYPIAINFRRGEEIGDFIQLDGSHRRCVASFLGFNEISSIVITLDEIEKNININKPAYFYENAETFFELIRKINQL